MNYSILTLYILSLLEFSVSSQVPQQIAEPCIIQADTQAIAPRLLTLADAETIMGEKAKLTGNSFLRKGDTLEYKCDYTALSEDASTGKTGKLYFMYEIYAGIPAAENAYTSIYKSNSGHEGVVIVQGLGNEAYYHTDQTGFYFFLVRKNAKLVRLKLNKITVNSSEIEFKKITKAIVEKL